MKFGVILCKTVACRLLTDRQTNKQTNKQTDRQTNKQNQKHNLIVGGNKISEEEIKFWIKLVNKKSILNKISKEEIKFWIRLVNKKSIFEYD